MALLNMSLMSSLSKYSKPPRPAPGSAMPPATSTSLVVMVVQGNHSYEDNYDRDDYDQYGDVDVDDVGEYNDDNAAADDDEEDYLE